MPAESWESAFADAAERGYNKQVAVPKEGVGGLPDEFTVSPLSIPHGSDRAFRDDAAIDSFHVREYENKWTVELDKYNPRSKPIKHLIEDVIKYFL